MRTLRLLTLPLILVVLLGLLLVYPDLGKSAEGTGPFVPRLSEAETMERVKQQIAAKDWAGAHATVKAFVENDKRPDRFHTEEFRWKALLHVLKEAEAMGPDQQCSQLIQLGKAAQRVGLFDQAIEHFESAWKAARADHERGWANSALVNCFPEAGAAAVVAKDYERTLRMYDLTVKRGEGWNKQVGQRRADLIRKLLSSLRNVACRIEFAQSFWVTPGNTVPEHSRHARQFLVETLELKPNQSERRQLYELIQSHSEVLSDRRTAEAYADRLVAEFANGPFAQIALAQAQFHQRMKNYDKGEQLLLGLLDSERGVARSSATMLVLANLYAAKGDSAKQVEWLKRCTEFPKTVETARNIMDTDNTRSIAFQQLAAAHESRGEWAEALKYWQAWKPSSWCGTCLASMRASRAKHLGLCSRHLRNHREAAEAYMDALFGDGLGWSSHLAVPLFQLYQDAGQLDDLQRVVDGYEQARLASYAKHPDLKNSKREDLLKYLPTSSLKELWRIQSLADKKDYATLIGLCRGSNRVHCDAFEEHEGDSDWRCKAAAEALAAGDGSQVELLREALKPQQEGSISWVIYALGRGQSPKALVVLEDLARTEAGWNCGNVVRAIAAHREPGFKILRQVAQKDKNGMGHAARQYLDRVAKGGVAIPKPPAPKPGSLPTELNLKKAID